MRVALPLAHGPDYAMSSVDDVDSNHNLLSLVVALRFELSTSCVAGGLSRGHKQYASHK
jgi:hypothetical protein